MRETVMERPERQYSKLEGIWPPLIEFLCIFHTMDLRSFRDKVLRGRNAVCLKTWEDRGPSGVFMLSEAMAEDPAT